MTQHIITVDDLTHEFLQELFDKATWIKKVRMGGNNNYYWKSLTETLTGKLLISDFFEPSTRTRLSFEAAMHYLGGNVIGTENAAEFSSYKKGESLEDNFRVLSGYCDIIVGRFLQEGEARRAAAACDVPLINGGDGKGEHPTQAMTDLFSIIEKFDDPEELTITFVGDNKRSRTVRSLALLLAGFGVRKMNFISPPDLSMEEHVCNEIAVRSKATCKTEIFDHLNVDRLRESNVVYVTRSQNERGGVIDHGMIFGPCEAALLPENAIILHPLPRNSELPVEVDQDPRAYYFEQARNGLYVRMALLQALCPKVPEAWRRTR